MTVKGHIGVFARCGDVRNEVLAILAPTALAFGRAGSRLSRSNIGCLFPILRRDLEGKVARCACTPRRLFRASVEPEVDHVLWASCSFYSGLVRANAAFDQYQ